MERQKFNNQKSRANRRKPPTPKTKGNKLTKLQALYRKLFKSSSMSKEKDKEPRLKPYFCDKYPLFNAFLTVHTLRKGEREAEVKRTVTNKKEIKKKGLLGGYK